MISLIELDDQHTDLHNPMPVSQKLFGVIKRECNVVDVTKLEENNVESLKIGTMIQIMPDYHGSHCHFKIRDFENWCDKYKTTIYKCSKDDYIVVNTELWPYLMALKNYEGRINFVNSVYNRKFDINLLKLGREIRIRATHDTGLKYLDFIVKYVGLVKSVGTGFYIALQLKNSDIALTKDLKCLSRYYEWDGVGIVVPADWIMLNLYSEDENQTKSTLKSEHEVSSLTDEACVETAVEVTEHNIENHCQSIEVSKEISGIIIREQQELGYTSQNQFDSTITINNNSPEIIGLDRHPIVAQRRSTDRLNKLTNDTGAIPKTCQVAGTKHDGNYLNQSNYTDEIKVLNNVEGSVKNTEEVECGLCCKVVEISLGFILRECLHSFCEQCIRSHVKRNIESSVIRCPYNKEYECKSDLLDVEIKDLGGKDFYDKILDNRLKEFVSTNPDARRCYNCKQVWYTLRDQHVNMEKCPKCSKSWCNLCNFPHEPHEAHGGGKQNKSTLKRFADWCLNKNEINCVKCHKINLLKNEYVMLESCKHSFCKDCIVPMIKGQISESQYATCIICKKRLNDNEVRLITSNEVLEMFVDNRKKENVMINTKMENCCCTLSASVCSIALECRHQFCQTSLAINIQKQLECNSRVTCPKCRMEIGQHVINKLVGQKKSDDTDICQICFKPAEIQLKKCRDLFCHKCIRETIVNQTQDHTKLFINCIACNDTIADSDISLYGGEDIFAIFKTKTITKDSQIEVECLKCEKKFEEKFIQKCSKCANSICLECAYSTISGQLKNKIIPKCLFCRVVLDDTLIASIRNRFKVQPESQFSNIKMMDKSDPIQYDLSNARPCNMLFECLLCEQSTGEADQTELTKCKHKTCRKCLQNTISNQMTWSNEPKCPICSINIDQDELEKLGISLISKTMANSIQHLEVSENMVPQNTALNPLLNDSDIHLKQKSIPLQINYVGFECIICENSIAPECGVILGNCGHNLCRNCIANSIFQQSRNNLAPTCPLCTTLITNDEFRMLDLRDHSNQLDDAKPNEFKNLEQSEVVFSEEEMYVCIICEDTFVRQVTKALTLCGDRFCRPCITKALKDQTFINKTPNCPMCFQEVIESDIIDLCGEEVKRCTTNKIITGDELKNLEQDEVNITEDEMYVCIICEDTYVPQATKVLTLCGDRFCRPCIAKALNDQFFINKTPNCPICCQEVIELDIIDLCGKGVEHCTTDKTNMGVEFKNSVISEVIIREDEMYVCIICEDTFVRQVTKALTLCGDRFCRPCITKALKEQTFINKTPNCPMCFQEVIESDIIDLCGEEVKRCTTNKIITGDELKNLEQDEVNITEDEMYVCIICEDTYVPQVTKALTLCGDRFCRQCITKALNDQSFINKTPNCPKCCLEVAGADIIDLCGSEGFKRYMVNKRNN